MAKSKTTKGGTTKGKGKTKAAPPKRKIRNDGDLVADQVKLVKALDAAPGKKLGTAKLSVLLKGERTPSQITSTVKGLKTQGVVTAEGKLRGTVYTLVPEKAAQFLKDAAAAVAIAA